MPRAASASALPEPGGYGLQWPGGRQGMGFVGGGVGGGWDGGGVGAGVRRGAWVAYVVGAAVCAAAGAYGEGAPLSAGLLG